MAIDGAGPARLFCPVAGCPCSDPLRTRGWANPTTMQSHVDAHLAGTLGGEVPQSWLDRHDRQRCGVCGLSVSKRFGIHPTCRPEARGQAASGAPRAAAPALPSLDAIWASQGRTLRHIPALARALWGQVLTRALATVATYNDTTSWAELFMLPHCVLCPPPRGGRKHQRAAAAYTLDRLRRWQEGERVELWHSRSKPSLLRARGPTEDSRRSLAESLAREGFDRKACAALLATGLCPENSATAAALRGLHPPGRLVPHAHDLPPAVEVALDSVHRALRHFPLDSAPGPSGLRVQHLLDACTPGSSDGFLQQLTAVVNLLGQGRACAEVAPFLAGASLAAVPKPCGGVRPLAVGEVLRRLVGKCLMAAARDDARAFFWPAQVGVAIKSGAEKAIHAAQQWHARNSHTSDRVAVKLDFANAFNTIDRASVLARLGDSFPGLARWAHWCYGSPSHLRFGAHQLSSSSGVQQGDPLGPLLFAVGLQPLAAELRAMPGLDMALFYLDDGFVAGEVTAVAAAIALVQQRAGALDLKLNLAKSGAIAVGALTFLLSRGPCPPTWFAMLLGTAASPMTLNSLVLRLDVRLS